MDRFTERVNLYIKDVLALRDDNKREYESAQRIAYNLAVLDVDAYRRYVREVEMPALEKYAGCRGWVNFHAALRRGAEKISQQHCKEVWEQHLAEEEAKEAV